MYFKRSCAVLFLSVLASIASAQQCVTKDVCLQKTQSPCSCETKDGMIDLSKVGTISAKGLKYKMMIQGMSTFFFNPCRKFTMGNCKDALMCEQFGRRVNTVGVTVTGLPATTKFAKCGRDMVIMYTHGSETAEVELVCDHKHDAILKMTLESFRIIHPHKFELRSKYACPRTVAPSTTVSPTVPSANTSVTVPTTNTVPSAKHTTTVLSTNKSVTVPSAKITATVPSANTTVTVPHITTTVTPAPNTTITTPTIPTTTKTSSASKTVYCYGVFFCFVIMH